MTVLSLIFMPKIAALTVSEVEICCVSSFNFYNTFAKLTIMNLLQLFTNIYG